MSRVKVFASPRILQTDLLIGHVFNIKMLLILNEFSSTIRAKIFTVITLKVKHNHITGFNKIVKKKVAKSISYLVLMRTVNVGINPGIEDVTVAQSLSSFVFLMYGNLCLASDNSLTGV